MGLTPVLQRFHLTRKAVPLIAPEGLVRVGTACSLEFSSSPGFLSVRPMKRSFPPFHSPLVSHSQKPHDFQEFKTSGSSVPNGSAFPPKGRQPAQPLVPTTFAISSKELQPRTIFSSRRVKNLYRFPVSSLSNRFSFS